MEINESINTRIKQPSDGEVCLHEVFRLWDSDSNSISTLMWLVASNKLVMF